MTKTLNIKTLQLRGDTKQNWESKNPVLAVNEMGIEKDTRKFKFGDGISAWTELDYAGADEVSIDDALSSTSTNSVQNKVITNALNGKLSTTGTATKATADASGNNIVNTYATKASLNNYVDLSTAQTISGAKTFTSALDAPEIVTSSVTVTNGVIKLAANNQAQLGSLGIYFQVGGASGSPTLTATQYTGNAATATKATNDSAGNKIVDTYSKKAETYTKDEVDAKVAGIVNSAPEALDTLNELAAALGNNPNFATTISTEIGKKANTADLAKVATSGKYSDLSGTPTSLPADGGNAATVGGFTVGTNVPADAVFTDTKYTLPNASTSAKGGVKIGSNITVSSGTISLTKSNVTSALGYTPPTTNTTYTVGTTSYSGTTKLYTGTGSNTDGTMTQKFITDTFAVKSDTYTKSQVDSTVDEKIANAVTGGTLDLSGYLTKTEAGNTYATKSSVSSLTTSNITEGNKLYYTEARATSNFNTNFATKTVTGLSDGANVVLDTDTIIINCGNA